MSDDAELCSIGAWCGQLEGHTGDCDTTILEWRARAETAETAEAERDRLREALQVILTDHAQDAFEDPIGHAERSANNWCRIGMGVITVVRAALAPDTAKEGT